MIEYDYRSHFLAVWLQRKIEKQPGRQAITIVKKGAERRD